jgi:glycerol kinase
MAHQKYLLAIDQGTTSTRAMLFDRDGAVKGRAQRELTQIFPREGWVEHDAEEIWSATLSLCRDALETAGLSAGDVAAIGITNQRETTVVWDRASGTPIHNAIVWQDRRTSEMCRSLTDAGHTERVRRKTGLVVDPYFSGTKVSWLLDGVPGARQAAEAGELCFGTIDSFLLWRLTAGARHATDATNASRTMLFDIHGQTWDPELLDLLGVPAAALPEVIDCAGDLGVAAGAHFGAEIPIAGIAGDQHAATVGQACFAPGMIKSTYGTGCFAVVNTGPKAVESKNRLLTTVAYRLEGEVTYALEGSIFAAGAAVQWLRDGLGLIKEAGESEALAASVPDTGGVYLVPAFTGLGAPYWDAEARGALVGLTRGSDRARIARAALESVCYQTRDLLDAMSDDGASTASLRVDGGMVANDWMLQFLADMIGTRVERPAVTETTALGAAYLAGLGVGLYKSLDEIAERWRPDARFTPAMKEADRERLYAGWNTAVGRIRS